MIKTQTMEQRKLNECIFYQRQVLLIIVTWSTVPSPLGKRRQRWMGASDYGPLEVQANFQPPLL